MNQTCLKNRTKRNKTKKKRSTTGWKIPFLDLPRPSHAHRTGVAHGSPSGKSERIASAALLYAKPWKIIHPRCALHCSPFVATPRPNPLCFPPPRWKFRANEGQAAIKGPQLKRRACNVKQPCAPIVLHQFVSPFIPLRFTILFCFLSFRENLENLLLVIVPDLRIRIIISGLELYTFFIAFSFAILDPELWIYNGYFFEKKGGRERKNFPIVSIFPFPTIGNIWVACFAFVRRRHRGWIGTGTDGNRVMEITRRVMKMDNYCANRSQKTAKRVTGKVNESLRWYYTFVWEGTREGCWLGKHRLLLRFNLFPLYIAYTPFLASFLFSLSSINKSKRYFNQPFNRNGVSSNIIKTRGWTFENFQSISKRINRNNETINKNFEQMFLPPHDQTD